MEVEQANRRERLGGAVEQVVEGAERRVELVHEDTAHGIDDRDLVTIGQVVDEPATAGRIGRVVDRAQDRDIGVEMGIDLALVPDVVAAGDDVDAAGQQLVRERRREAHPGCDVLAVGDDEVEVELVPEVRQRMADRDAPGLADDVADHPDAQAIIASPGIGHRA